MLGDHATINADFDFRRYAIKPMPAKPKIIIAHVDGSGTAEQMVPANPGLSEVLKFPPPVYVPPKAIASQSTLLTGAVEVSVTSKPLNVRPG